MMQKLICSVGLGATLAVTVQVQKHQQPEPGSLIFTMVKAEGGNGHSDHVVEAECAALTERNEPPLSGVAPVRKVADSLRYYPGDSCFDGERITLIVLG